VSFGAYGGVLPAQRYQRGGALLFLKKKKKKKKKKKNVRRLCCHKLDSSVAGEKPVVNPPTCVNMRGRVLSAASPLLSDTETLLSSVSTRVSAGMGGSHKYGLIC